MEQMVNDIKLAIQTALKAGEDRLKVQLKVKEIADGLNNPEIMFHAKQPVAPTPPEPEVPEVTVTSVSPNTGVVGQDLELAVSGSGFTAASVVTFDDDPVPTTFVSETELTASIPAANNDAVDTFEVTVDGATPAIPFEVTDLPVTGRREAARESPIGRHDDDRSNPRRR